MAGHSHAANIAARKGAMDKKRGKIFTKLARRLIVEARLGGPDVETNIGLRLAYEKARAANMPKDVIQRNIDKGAGVGADAAVFETVVYEGYAAGGIAVMAEALTDNRHRTGPEMKKLFERGGGALGAPGCVSYMFDVKSVYLVKAPGKTEDQVMEAVLELGADDMESAGGSFMITAQPNLFVPIKQGIEARGFTIELAEIQRLAQNTVQVGDVEQARTIQKLVDLLEDNDDVENVFTNHSLDDEVAAKLKG